MTQPGRIFLLSPAWAGGKRAELLRSDRADFPLARQVRASGAPIGEVFSFLSGLYFRGKLAYSARFQAPPPGVPGALVITAHRGLAMPETIITLDELRDIAEMDIDGADPRYRLPLERDAGAVAAAAPQAHAVLLGSIATAKYVEPLLAVFGERLLFPAAFVGRGDMSRGGLMLRAARSGVELDYIPVLGAILHGPRPPKLGR